MAAALDAYPRIEDVGHIFAGRLRSVDHEQAAERIKVGLKPKQSGEDFTRLLMGFGGTGGLSQARGSGCEGTIKREFSLADTILGLREALSTHW